MDNNKDDQERRRLDGYYEGASGRKFQPGFDNTSHGQHSFRGFGDDARWKNSTRAEHYNNDYFGLGNRDRSWANNLDNRHTDQRKHYGKGPKGYSRSNDKIYQDVCEALTNNSDIDASEIEVTVIEGIVTLTGTVDSRRIKRLAEDVADTVLGVEDVMNMLMMTGEAKGDQIDESGSALGGNPNQESKTGNWPPPSAN